MFVAPTTPPHFFDPTLEYPKMEFCISDERINEGNLWKDIVPVNTIYNRKFVDLEQSKKLAIEFAKQLMKKSSTYANTNNIDLITYFIKGSRLLLKHSPKNITVELTNSKSLYFFAQIDTNNIYLEVFFDEVTGKYAATAVNIYENKVQKLATSGSFLQVSNELEEHVTSLETDNYLHYILIPKEISDSTFAPA